ncbi:DUF1461 domain-containing protein [Eggerthellaceae bacterium zg-1084]|uniref:lipoprotein intramolecular transacylase Lit n=1 Tax=Berryella wangjianweii TaxID=2734634 RepID=UPI00155506F6|nr:DUF1461 domain-containing protein [Berryella wangjianweii]NPD31513.1 DUF1461 domain-containing protein [Berryella wangjianweii]
MMDGPSAGGIGPLGARRILSCLVTAALTALVAVVLVLGGLLPAMTPGLTHALSERLAWSDLSPFDSAQLAQVAEAARDYSFGGHDKQALYDAVLQVNRQLSDERAAQGASKDDGRPAGRASGTPAGAPRLDHLASDAAFPEVQRVLDDASDAYVLGPEAIGHLDDVFAVGLAAKSALIAALALLAGTVLGTVMRSRALHARDPRDTDRPAPDQGRPDAGQATCERPRETRDEMALATHLAVLARPLRSAARMTALALAALGLWAAIDFMGLFTAFHQVFFAQGTWTFSARSLLICALPTELWMTLGGIWLAGMLALCAAAELAGRRLARKGRATTRTPAAGPARR